MKKCNKIILIIMCIVIITMLAPKVVVAGPIDNPGSYIPVDPGGGTEIKNIGNTIIGAINVVGTVISVVALMLIGVRYMLGSVDDKAQYKETMIPYIIGAVLLFATTTVVNILYKLAIDL